MSGTDLRPFAERKGEYAENKFGSPAPVRAPQDYGSWDQEFNAVVSPGLERPHGAPQVSIGFSRLKEKR